MIATAELLRTRGRRLDRINRELCAARARLARGETLTLEFRWYGRRWLLGGKRLEEQIADLLVESGDVVGDGYALFDDVPSQTYRTT
jgi:hypothetical protein